MMKTLPKKSGVFNCTYISVKSSYIQARKRLARKLAIRDCGE